MTHALATVGSTCFPALTEFLSLPSTLQLLSSLSFTSLSVQHGTHPFSSPKQTAISLNAFSYYPDLSTHLRNADLVISHAGAGTISEVVRLNKPLLVVINDALMHDHQTELALAMERHGKCAVVRGSRLEQEFEFALRKAMEDSSENKLPQQAHWALAAVVAQELGKDGIHK